MDSLNSWLADIPDGWVLLAACATLAALFVPVGLKAGAPGVMLKSGAGYEKAMLAFQLNAGAAPEMFETWDDDTKRKLRTALMWDFLFIFIYPGLISALCLSGAKYLDAAGYPGFRVSLVFIMMALFAALLDAFENCALLTVLHGSNGTVWPAVARYCAIPKFALAFIAGGYALLVSIAAAALWLYNSVAGRPSLPS
jgi:hypothetical protein